MERIKNMKHLQNNILVFYKFNSLPFTALETLFFDFSRNEKIPIFILTLFFKLKYLIDIKYCYSCRPKIVKFLTRCHVSIRQLLFK